MESKRKFKFIECESEHLFASNVEEFMNRPDIVIACPPSYFSRGVCLCAMIEYSDREDN